ncbi:receptor-type tyrosine-protein phosphatase S-like [Diadema antillarum]|uniref:receptor-type tyrosine-protein phosphatase S-like n=1 Tax=Diadema antillarum TaxID=105358 RepID=UPI003A879C1F
MSHGNILDFPVKALASHAIVATVAILCVNVVQGQSPFISTTSRWFTSAESRESYFACYRSAPDLDATVSTGRYVYTMNGQENNFIPPAAVFVRSRQYQLTRLSGTSNHRSFGAFYCSATKDGQSTVVPTIFLRSAARFVPAEGRFSKTVNAGDVNVIVDFSPVGPISDEAERNWRHNGTYDVFDLLSRYTGAASSYTIAGEVTPANGGVYELHLAGERASARAGLLRLIVRDCPAGRYDVLGGCLQACKSCYNGGICHSKTGECVCPPGFMGDQCEQMCGGNRFGRNCEYRCKDNIDDQTACSGLQVCVPDPYGCSCTPGYKGIHCTEECGTNEFGASCTQTCHCVSGECDPYTGACTGSSTECRPGWTGSNCQECTVGKYGTYCAGTVTVNYEKPNQGQPASVTCSLSGSRFLSLADPIVKLQRKHSNESFHERDIELADRARLYSDGYTAVFIVSDVQDEEKFRCMMSDVTTFMSHEVIEGFYVLPQLPSPPIVDVATNNSVTLAWDAWNEETDVGDPPLSGYQVYYKEKNIPGDFIRLEMRTDRLAPSETITNLTPDTDFIFAVSAERPGVGGIGDKMEVEGRTLCSPPSEGPSSVEATNGSRAGQIKVTWQNPINGSNCRSGFTGIRIYYAIAGMASADMPEMYEDVPFESPSNHTLTGLKPSSQYTINVVARNQDSESSRGQSVVAFTPEQDPAFGRSIVAVIAGSLIATVVLIIVSLVFNIARRRKKDRFPGVFTYNVGSELITSSPPHASRSGPIAAESLEEYVRCKKAMQKDGFLFDFRLLPVDEPIPQTVSSKPENKTKNRFKNILAYDHSRVILETVRDDPHSDYYNANFIRNHKGEKMFIASQAPNSASIQDFWRMIWQYRVNIVVMINNTIEAGKDRCTVYWPEKMSSSIQFEQMVVTLRTIVERSGSIHRVMDVQQVDRNEVLKVHQFHFLAWENLKSPEHPTTLLTFTRAVKQAHQKYEGGPSGSAPILVHCSAGVGRTGTFITLYCMLDQLQEEGRVNIFDFIKQMREDRPKMVQTVDQYIFLHTALVEAYLSGNTEIPVREYRDHLMWLHQRDALTNKLNIELEFERLIKLIQKSSNHDQQNLRSAMEDCNSDVLPGAVCCSEVEGNSLETMWYVEIKDCIKATFLNTFMRKDAFVATQTPLPYTRGDIWRFIYDWKCPVIIMLNQMDESDETCVQYWPDQDCANFGPLCVTITSGEVSQQDYAVREFRVKGEKEVLVVKQYQVFGWSARKARPLFIKPLLAVMDAANESMKKSRSSGPILLHCMNGIGRCGVFATVYSTAEKMISDGTIDVFQAVMMLGENRGNMVESLEQYMLCYDALAEHMKKFEKYR